jgi:hypothetical protein
MTENNISQQHIKQTLVTPGSLYNAVINNPSVRGLYWVQEELEETTQLRTGCDQVGATVSSTSSRQKNNNNKRKNVSWSKPGEILTCPFKTFPGDVLPSDKIFVAVEENNTGGNTSSSNKQQEKTTTTVAPPPSQPPVIKSVKVVDLSVFKSF